MQRSTGSMAVGLGIAAIARLAGAGSNPTLPAAFTFEGPAPIAPGVQNPVAAGAVEAIAIDPGDPNRVWIGTVNGGVWKTNDFRPDRGDHAPTWKPLTDDMPGLSIGALSIDPTDGKSRTLVAGTAHPSSAWGTHGPLIGLLRTTDGGTSWTPVGEHDLVGKDIVGVAARGATIVVATGDKTNGGIWRSTDTGATFTRISGTTRPTTIVPMPDGPATALVGDPSHPERLWAGVVGLLGGVYRSEDTGATWTLVSPTSLGVLAQDALKLALDAQAYPHDTTAVYVAVINPKPATNAVNADIPAVFRIVQAGVHPATVDEMDKSVLPAFETLDQGKVAIAADPTQTDTFFVGGDEGLLYRCTRPVGGSHAPTCTPISDKKPPAVNTGSGTKPHADTRGLTFDGDFGLISIDDGGIYMRTFPRMKKGDWGSKNGNLGITEALSCAYDDHGDVIFCGNQDNGVAQQPQPGVTVWPQLQTTDGGIMAVSDALFPCPWDKKLECSARYISRHKLADFTQFDCDQANKCQPAATSTASMLKLHGTMIGCSNPSNPSTCGDPNVVSLTPLAADRFDAQRIVVATTVLYESSDGGATVTKVQGFKGTATRAIVLGGERSGTKNADVLYVGSSDGLFARSAAGAVVKTTWKVAAHGQPMSIALEHGDWSSVWITTDAHKVWHGTGVQGTHEAWTEVTGDLSPGGRDARDVRAIAFIGGAHPTVVVGADDGAYAMEVANSGHWFKLTGALPNAVVYDLSYSKLDDKLVIATLGRSVWAIDGASKLFAAHASHMPHDPVKP